MSRQKQSNFWNTPLTSSLIKGKDVRPPEMLIGYFIGPIDDAAAVFDDTDRHSESGRRTADRENEGACGKGKTMDTSVSSYTVSGIGADVYRAF